MARTAFIDSSGITHILCNCGREWPYYPGHSTICLMCGYSPNCLKCMDNGIVAHVEGIGGEGFDMCECQDVQVESWRSMKGDDYLHFRAWVDKELADRWSLGERKYKSHVTGFKGNPLDHAIEESLDLVLYLFMEKRKQEGE